MVAGEKTAVNQSAALAKVVSKNLPFRGIFWICKFYSSHRALTRYLTMIMVHAASAFSCSERD